MRVGMSRTRAGRYAAGGAAGLLALGTGVAVAATLVAGPQGDGTAVTPVGYRVTPAGRQTTLGDLPLGMALSPDGGMLLVSNDGQGTQSLQVVDPRTSQVRQTIAYASPQSLFAGLGFSPDGSRAYASGGGDEQIHTYAVSGGRLTETAPIALPATDAAGNAVNMFPAGLAVAAGGSRLVVADHLADAASVVDVATGAVQTVAVGHAPYGVAVMGDTAYVTNQGAGTVSVVDLRKSAPRVVGTVRVGTHPNAVIADPAGHRVFVADGDSDEVSVIDAATDTVRQTVSLAPYADARVGSTPLALALAPDGKTLYVANAGNNAVAVVDLARGQVTGTVPTGWYPSAVVATDSSLFVANAKGLGAGPNDGPGRPDPTSSSATSPDQYVGSMMAGTLSTVDLPLSAGQLAHGTQQVRRNNGYARANARGGDPQPIEHVIYIVKENRTFDQVFGSLGKGNGEASLNLFGDESAPNQRALEKRFVTLDNFYADAEISAQGWNWSVAANSNPYSEALWPANYSGRNAPYPSENGDPAIAPNVHPADAYIWDRLADNGVTFRNYGFYVHGSSTGGFHAADPKLEANTDHAFRGFDLACPSNADTFAPRRSDCGTPRFDEWKREFDQYVRNGNLPTVELVRLPNDHTAGTRTGYPTPRAYVADNDLALGRLVDAVSHSPYWQNTAIFVTEDDAQNGPDHVDAHRTTSQVISPYTQTGAVDSTFYSTASMLRTIEDLVGIRPLTQFDAFATPMSAAFSSHPNDRTYQAVRPQQAGNTTNGSSAPMAAASNAQRLDVEDAINMATFNEAIWRSVKGADSDMPAPRHALRPSTAPGGGG